MKKRDQLTPAQANALIEIPDNPQVLWINQKFNAWVFKRTDDVLGPVSRTIITENQLEV